MSPNNKMPDMTNAVMTGLRMNNSGTVIEPSRLRFAPTARHLASAPSPASHPSIAIAHPSPPSLPLARRSQPQSSHGGLAQSRRAVFVPSSPLSQRTRNPPFGSIESPRPEQLSRD